MQRISQRITQCILQSGLSMIELSQASGQSQAAVYRWLNGSALPGVLGLAGLCKALGVSADWLLGLRVHGQSGEQYYE